MSCPMNCPKQMRNGPCGGVRPNGHCEVKPEMRCVWVQAWEGSRRMAAGDRITELQPPVDHRRKGSSSWLRMVRGRRLRMIAAGPTAGCVDPGDPLPPTCPATPRVADSSGCCARAGSPSPPS